MIEIELDGQKVSVPEGSMVMHAADQAGTYIPHFCYHKKLSIAANCRMCLVEIEKAPKPMPACATPVTQGMVVRTKSDKAINAQQGVMEFLLINHPLDCPICDQGGECLLQDLAVGYGASASRYDEDKRVVYPKDVGPLLSMQEMNRCIHCTRCVRFGIEVGGVMELGMIHRGEHSEITTIAGDTVDSELSGNMIDLCPVGAITSKPFRYSARAWELSRRKSVSPHDSTGANLIVQVKLAEVMRVLPLENEDVNECWLADRDRFSYEALDARERLTVPMVKQGGEWKTVSWTDALDYVARGLTQISVDHGAQSIGALAAPMSTVEELHLLAKLVRGLGSENVDTRLREVSCRPQARSAGSAARSPSLVDASARPRRRLVPAQGPSAVRAAAPPGGEEGRQGDERPRRARRLADADGAEHRSRAERMARGARGDRRRGRRGEGNRRAGRGRAERRSQGDRRRAAERRAQGRAARQRRRPALRRARDRAPRALDRRADRRDLRLALRRRECGRRAARRRQHEGRRPRRRAHARRRRAARPACF